MSMNIQRRRRTTSRGAAWTTGWQTWGLLTNDQWPWSIGPAWGCQYLTLSFLVGKEWYMYIQQVWPGQQDDNVEQKASEGLVQSQSCSKYLFLGSYSYLPKQSSVIQSLLQLSKADSEETSRVRMVCKHTDWIFSDHFNSIPPSAQQHIGKKPLVLAIPLMGIWGAVGGKCKCSSSECKCSKCSREGSGWWRPVNHTIAMWSLTSC